MKANNVLSIYLCFLLVGLYAVTVTKAYSASTHTVDAVQKPSACITINQVHFIGVQWLTEIAPRHIKAWRQNIEGQCVDEQGLLDYADYITEELVNAGYLTSYVHYPEQSFLFGVLQAEIVIGAVSSVVYQNGNTKGKLLPHIFPFKIGNALNLRYLEQGLYNLQNTSLLPFHINLVPDDADKNATQVIVVGQYHREMQGTFSIGSHSIAGQRGDTVSHTLMVANPLLWSDFLYTKFSGQFSHSEGTEIRSATLSYSVPYHYWLFSASSDFQQNQTIIKDYDVDLPLQQRNWFLLLQAEYLVRRTESSTTSLSVGSQIQTSDTFLSGLHLKTQQRLANYIIGGLSHQVDFSRGNNLVTLKYKQGTDWFGANAQQMTRLNKPQVLQLSLSTLRIDPPFQYQSQFDVQLSRDKLDALLDQEALVGMGGVSGFIGGAEYFEMGDNSLKLQNELQWYTPWSQVVLYGSLGLGATANERATFWKENLLLGGRVGAKGQLGHLSFHLFVESPFWQVDQVRMDSVSSGLQISLTY